LQPSQPCQFNANASPAFSNVANPPFPRLNNPMTAALKVDFLNPEEYLEGEKHSDIRHEYVGGIVHAMAGGSLAHNRICGNIFAFLHGQLRGGRCNVYMADAKVRLFLAQQHLFYYPDVMVACDPRDTDSYFCNYPNLIIEVLSESTEDIDRREKLLNYIQIETLETYLLLSQDRAEGTLFRRQNDWRPELIDSSAKSIPITSLSLEIPLNEIYSGIHAV
jgi:Uma2 family endonuclease